MEEEAAREEKKNCSRPALRLRARSPAETNKTTTDLPSRALGASRAKRPAQAGGAGGPGESAAEKGTRMHDILL